MARTSNFTFILRALNSPNYRLFFGGQLISLIGTFFTMTATQWLVYRLADPLSQNPAHAAAILGIVGFASQIPIFLLAPFAGIWIDRLNTHRIIVVTQTFSMLVSFALAFLALRHIITIPQIIFLNACKGLINAIDIPARQAFVVQMIENREDLSNGIALNSSMVHGSRIIGPAIAGILIYNIGEGYCFLLDGLSFLAVIGALLAMHVARRHPPLIRRHPLRDFHEGLSYAFGSPPIRTLLLLIATVSLMGMAQTTLMPIMAHTILKGQVRTYGILLCASGCGAFVGSIYLAARRTVVGLGRVIAAAVLILGLAVLAFSFSTHLWLSLPLLVVVGGMWLIQSASSNTILQTIVDDDKRGRIMSLFAVAFIGTAPFGALLAGRVATHLGAPLTIRLSGLACLIAGLVFLTRLRHLRPLVHGIYIQKGILPQIAAAIQATEPVSSGPPEG